MKANERGIPISRLPDNFNGGLRGTEPNLIRLFSATTRATRIRPASKVNSDNPS